MLQTPLSKTEKNRRHIAKLKETGRYDEYKKKKAKNVKQWRSKVKQNEKYLAPEIQLHVLNERRRATRERVKRWRDRKLQKSTEMNVIEKIEPTESFDAIEAIEPVVPSIVYVLSRKLIWHLLSVGHKISLQCSFFHLVGLSRSSSTRKSKKSNRNRNHIMCERERSSVTSVHWIFQNFTS